VTFLNELVIRVLMALRSERGQGVVEYGLIIGVVSLALIVAIALIFTNAMTALGLAIGNCLDGNAATACGPFGL